MRKLIGLMRGRQTMAGPIAPARPRRRIDLGQELPRYPIYAIGDVHGCLEELRDAEQRIAADMKSTGRPGMVILLGDYIDRGPCSSQVIDHLVAPSTLGLRRIPLCGNHDDIFAKFLHEPARYADWLAMGGEQTLRSYGLDSRGLEIHSKEAAAGLKVAIGKAVPASHRHFLAHLPLCLRIGDLIFVHAGLRPRVPLEQQEDDDLLWIREPFLSQGPGWPVTVVHGHTPHATPSLGPGRIGIDTGAYYTGRLTVLKIDSERKTFI